MSLLWTVSNSYATATQRSKAKSPVKRMNSALEHGDDPQSAADARGLLRGALETIVVSGLGLGLAWYGAHGASTVDSERAAWLTLLPVLCAGQHGMFCGLLSAALICGFSIAGAAHGVTAELQHWHFVYVAVGAVVGLFRDLAQRDARKLRDSTRQQAEQLEHVQRELQTVRLSHRELEQRFESQPASLHVLLGATAARMDKLASPHELATLLLEVLASQAPIRSATLYEVRGNEVPQLPLAVLGKPFTAAYRHPFVARAVATRRLVTVLEPLARASAQPGVVVAMPLHASDGSLRYVLAIHDLAFAGFHTPALRSLFTIALRVTDIMHDRLRRSAAATPAVGRIASPRRVATGSRTLTYSPRGHEPTSHG